MREIHYAEVIQIELDEKSDLLVTWLNHIGDISVITADVGPKPASVWI